MHFFLFRKAIRKLPGDVIQGVPLPEPELTDGFGSRAQAGIICRKMGAKSVLVVTDKNIHGLGFHEKILLSLRDSGISFTVFCEIDSEPTVEVIRAGRKAALDCGAVWCGIARQEDPAEEAADRMIAALRQLLEKCGLEKGCVELREEDYPQLVKMIDADSINYSPPKTFSDREIIGLLDRIRKGGGA